MADRIQGWAVRRCGELLKQVEAAQGGGEPNRLGGGPPGGRSKAAHDAGLSRYQKQRALRVANVDDDEFGRLIESVEPPSVTELADLGTNKRQVDYGDRTPEELAAARDA